MSSGMSSQCRSTVSISRGICTGKRPVGTAFPLSISSTACCCTPKATKMASAYGSLSAITVGLCMRRHTITGFSPARFLVSITKSRSLSLAAYPVFPQ